VNDPHLVACSAGSDIETLFENLIAQREASRVQLYRPKK